MQYRRVTDRQTDTLRRQRPRYAVRRAGKNVLFLVKFPTKCLFMEYKLWNSARKENTFVLSITVQNFKYFIFLTIFTEPEKVV